jgi:hypothetical protein
MTTIASRIAALGAPRGIQVVLAEVAGVGANDATNWIKGRQVSEHRRLKLEDALSFIEDFYRQPIRPELSKENIARAAHQKMLQELGLVTA